jgi:acetyl esterase/lipase
VSRRFVLVAVAAVAVLGLGLYMWPRGAAQQPRPAVRYERDVEFARPGGVPLKVDLALPGEGSGPYPAVVCLHGGGWVAGDRKQMAQTIDVLGRRGYVAAAPDYRLAPTHRFPACVEDCKAAVRWLRANAGKYRIDPKRIGVVGLSAGGHLALLLAVTGPGDGLEGSGGNSERSSAVQAVASFAGPADLTSEELWTKEVLTRNLEPLFGGPPQAKLDLYRKASPRHYSPAPPPPALLVHGSRDLIVPVRQAHDLANRLRELGGKASVVVLEGQGHTWHGLALLESIDKMLTFLDAELKKSTRHGGN